jgi:hypothetical protein
MTTHDTILRDILAAVLTRARESIAERNDPANSRQHRLAEDAAARRVSNLHAQAAHAFGKINGWRTDANYNFTPERLGRPHNSYDYRCRGWRDHALYYKAPRTDGKRGWINVAIVGQPYGLTTGTCGEIENLVSKGFILHVPPAGPRASIWYPSATLFLVLTLPSIAVRWLPEQSTPCPELTPQDRAAAADLQNLASIRVRERRAAMPRLRREHGLPPAA